MRSTTGHVVVATDKFKGSLSAAEVAMALRTGIATAAPEIEVVVTPVADGGEGTVEAALASGFDRRAVTVTGADGAPRLAAIAVGGDTAVVELAQASGLQQIDPAARRPLEATSYGTGELVRAALDAGCRTVIIGLGGSASTDGGAGLVQALGVRLLDAAGHPIGAGGGSLVDLAQIDLSELDRRVGRTRFILASDVDNPLLGVRGAAAVFAPQKGADPAEVEQLEAGLTHWAEQVTALGQDWADRDWADQPGAGAAGGVGFAALAFLDAEPRPGVELLLEMVGFADALRGARLVITGEGSLDTQSLGGKAPVGVARLARRLGVPTLAVAGVTSLPEASLAAAGFTQTYTLQQIEPDLSQCIAHADRLLESVGRQIAADWLRPRSTSTEHLHDHLRERTAPSCGSASSDSESWASP